MQGVVFYQLLATGISDTLTLKPDCLSMREERYLIRSDKVKLIIYEKATGEKLARFILKAI